MTQSLFKRHHPLAVIDEQRRIISGAPGVASFESRMSEAGFAPLTATGITTFQINVGKLCNQVCGHCHVDAGPDRREIMTRETMELSLAALAKTNAAIVDITGGAPEMNPDFRWLVDQLVSMGRHVIDRSNLTILVTQGYEDMPEFLASRRVEVVASLPSYTEKQTDAQRGEHVFERSIAALKRLNGLGYGIEGSGLALNLVFNPVGAFLPPKQGAIEADYKRELRRRHGVEFNHLYTITNIPISRYLEFLISSGNYEPYMKKLAGAFNADAAKNVMCRTTVSVGWDGRLYDCDFNQMLDMTVDHGLPTHIRDFDPGRFGSRVICTGNHCYACTAGAGSSCTGSVA